MKKILCMFLSATLMLSANAHRVTIETLLSQVSEADLREFAQIYKERPIENNDGGMKAVGMFWVWYVVKHIQPDLIVESGIWKGQSTWLLEQAAPNAPIIALDPRLDYREYISESERVTYASDDFSTINFGDISDKNALVFFDDHQDAFARVQQASQCGFTHILFDDNYPVGAGGHLTLQHCFNNPEYKKYSDVLQTLIKTYLILPQLVGNTTRTGHPTQDHVVETLNIDPQGALTLYRDDALSYRWTTYVALEQDLD